MKLRVPASTTAWRDYATPIAFTAGLLSALLVAVVGVDALAVVAPFVGFRLGALVAGLVAYNLLTVALLWLHRRRPTDRLMRVVQQVWRMSSQYPSSTTEDRVSRPAATGREILDHA
ncbi:hypothetical protein [Haladaptatus salinisoli]|uniref:hypothetical protein n=1 Tax=Haladaptatus salinisoli TaxID=2884876 RepID=UPI001D0A305F|nr:hypothetical protein [Haladaptatus salinisoli]